MSETRSALAEPGPLRLKGVALPAEHGGWGMLAEPILVGLLIAPSWAGGGVAVAALGAFLARHPLKLALADRLRGTGGPRTTVALGFVVAYGLVAALGLAMASTGAPGWWIPLAAVAPFALVQLSYDTGHRGRQLAPELAGSVALSAVVSAQTWAAGWALAPCLAVGALFAARGVGAVLYVRTRLRRDRGLNPDRSAALAIHGGALVAASLLAAGGQVPWLAAVAWGLLLARAVRGLSGQRPPARPQAVGLQEMVYGISFALLLALGYALPL